MSSTIDDVKEVVDLLGSAVEAFSNSAKLINDLSASVKGHEEKGEVKKALLELVDAILVNLRDIDEATKALDALGSMSGKKLSDSDAGVVERRVEFGKDNLRQISKTLLTGDEIVGTRFVVFRALLRSLGNQYEDLASILNLMPIPKVTNPVIEVGLRDDIDFFRRKKEDMVKEAQRVRAKVEGS